MLDRLNVDERDALLRLATNNDFARVVEWFNRSRETVRDLLVTAHDDRDLRIYQGSAQVLDSFVSMVSDLSAEPRRLAATEHESVNTGDKGSLEW